jgi:hypothetical protein
LVYFVDSGLRGHYSVLEEVYMLEKQDLMQSRGFMEEAVNGTGTEILED